MAEDDPFALLGLEPSFAVDPAALRSALLREGARWHPDRFALADDAERDAAETRMTALNRAFETLADPLRRAELLLLRVGIDAHGRETCPIFLMDVMELREGFDERTDGAEQAMIDREERAMATLAEAFADWEKAGMRPEDTGTPATALTEATYLHRVLAEAQRASSTRG